MTNQHTIKIAILSPLLLEQEAIHKHLEKLTEKQSNGLLFYEGLFKGKNHRFDVVTYQTGSGNEQVTWATEKIIQIYNPTIIFLIGIAGGVKDVKIFDVVVGTKAYGYDNYKETEDGIYTRPEVITFNNELVSLAKTIAKNNNWPKRLSQCDISPNVFFGPIASGNKVIATTKGRVFNILKTRFNNTLALEMEAIGFGKVVNHYPQIRALNIRSISDCLDDKQPKTDLNNQPIAANCAAAFTFELLYHLDISQFNFQTMDIKDITNFFVSKFSPFLKKGQTAETVAKQLSTSADSSLMSIWDKVKPLFVEEFEEDGTFSEEIEEPKIVGREIRKKLKRDEKLRIALIKLIEQIDQGTTAGSTAITNSKNVIASSNILVGGDFRLGDDK